jgi:hypothetical protein
LTPLEIVRAKVNALVHDSIYTGAGALKFDRKELNALRDLSSEIALDATLYTLRATPAGERRLRLSGEKFRNRYSRREVDALADAAQSNVIQFHALIMNELAPADIKRFIELVHNYRDFYAANSDAVADMVRSCRPDKRVPVDLRQFRDRLAEAAQRWRNTRS